MTEKCTSSIFAILGFFLGSIANAQSIPFHPQSVEVMGSESANQSGQSRLRVSVTVDPGEEDKAVFVGNVTACSEVACYRPTTSTKSIALSTTSDGNALTVVEFAIPRIKIISVHFEGLAGAKTIAGSTRIINPMNFDSEYFGESVLVLLQKSVSGNVIRYSPRVAVAGPFHPAAQTVYYNPSVPTVAILGMATTLSIPRSATQNPVVFSVSVHDTLDRFPLVDIYPTIGLSPAAVLSSRQIRQGEGAAQSAEKSDAALLAPPASAVKSVPYTGLIRLDSSAESLVDRANLAAAQSSSTVSATAAATDSCTLFLSSKELAISSAITGTGTVFLRGCENTPPYIHIAVTNVLDTREYGRISFETVGGDARVLLRLKTLPVLALGSQVAINGFTWNGDSGITDGTGYALGFVQNETYAIANNLIGGGVQTFGTYDNNKLVLNQETHVVAKWKEGFAGPLWTYGSALPSFIVGSSTSIIKNGSCSGDSSINRWSAIGSTPSGRLVFVSSTSSGTTSAAELCSVFASLGSNFAIRLDGSTATGMTIDGILVNPIVGSSALVYGSSRRIGYAVKMMSTAAVASTPVISAAPNVPPPTDPCKINPRRCQRQGLN